MTASVPITTPAPTGSSWVDNPLEHLVRLCLIFLQELWKEAPPGNFKWDPDEIVSELLITDDAPLEPEVIEKRPAIVSVLSQCGWAGIGLDQLQNLSIRTGERIHTDLISGNITLNCLSRVKTEAQLIAWVTANHFWVLKYILMKLGFHKIGEQTQILAASPPGALISGDTEAEIVNVAVVIPFHFQHSVTVNDTGLKVLERIENTITVSMANPSRPTNQLMAGGWGTGLYQQSSGGAQRAQFQNMKGNIRPPTFRGRPLTAVVPGNYIGGGKADPPVTQTVVIDEE